MPAVKRDTIAAIATPPGRGGIGIVRVSGSGVADLVEGVVHRPTPPRQAVYADFLDANQIPIDTGICLFFPTPNSFTGEDVAEFHGHGGPVVMDRLLGRMVELGARLARPGEFTERAFLNKRMDLAQAEAVADLIDSASRRAAQAAMRSLAGEFSAQILALDSRVREARMHVEAAIDFAEEEIDFLGDSELKARLEGVLTGLGDLLEESGRGQVLRDGLDVVIAGAPNVGKSSLLNRLAAEERAIVTATPGTTRDAVHAEIEVQGIPVRLTDTAGLRQTSDDVESIGIDRARAAIAGADLVLAVTDAAAPTVDADANLRECERAQGTTILVVNKIDLTGESAGQAGETLRISARTGAGIDDLKRRIAELAGIAPTESTYLARRRHLQALEAAQACARRALRRTGDGAGELAAEELRLAHEALGTIVGTTTTDELLGDIFSAFCIGK
ncbi:MAG: tRNA uridine-5-carboxymethylaminomethyl(34) synthesis GTPase MnmE [Gammaproteobacteria bacterium]|nr:tRNA uridine-5-carboxymethylaminomethyl(34) synthesis GTPase MnmE [Gammaproteobacteria bacterium]